MTDEVAGNYLRACRRKCKLDQWELGILVGYGYGHAVGRHERSEAAPPLLIALAYEIVFDVPVGQLFTGFHAVVAQAVLRNIEILETESESQPGGKHTLDPEKLQWLVQLKQRIERSAHPRQMPDS